MKNEDIMNLAISVADDTMTKGYGGPFGAAITDTEGNIVATGSNHVIRNNDPTAHGEIVCIRNACQKLNTYDLSDYILYTTAYPCPMCLSAIYWSGIKKIYYGNTRKDAADINFDDDFIYKEIPLPMNERSVSMEQLDREEAIKAFKNWMEKSDKIEY